MANNGVGDISNALRFDADDGTTRCADETVGGVDADTGEDEDIEATTGVGIGAAGSLVALGVNGTRRDSPPKINDEEDGGGDDRATEDAGEEKAEMSTNLGWSFSFSFNSSADDNRGVEGVAGVARRCLSDCWLRTLRSADDGANEERRELGEPTVWKKESATC